MSGEIREVAVPVITSVEPQLFVKDIGISCEFYRTKLGFSVAFVYGDPPFYAQVERDSVRLNLRQVPERVFAGQIRQRENLLSATFTVATTTAIEQLFLEYQSANVPFQQTLKKEPWSAKTFVVSDPDRNLILFAGPAE